MYNYVCTYSNNQIIRDCSIRTVTFTQCKQLATQLHTTTASKISAEHHIQFYTVLFSWRWA